jgi:hypothetical protein
MKLPTSLIVCFVIGLPVSLNGDCGYKVSLGEWCSGCTADGDICFRCANSHEFTYCQFSPSSPFKCLDYTNNNCDGNRTDYPNCGMCAVFVGGQPNGTCTQVFWSATDCCHVCP